VKRSGAIAASAAITRLAGSGTVTAPNPAEAADDELDVEASSGAPALLLELAAD
jgi:hypothetical protein